MNHRRSPFVASIGLLLCVSACKGGNETKPAPAAPPPSASVVTRTPPTGLIPAATDRETLDHGLGHGGVDAVLFRATGDLALTEDQKKKLIALAAGDVRDREAIPKAMKAFAGDLSAEVSAGKIDPASFKADEAAIDDAMKATTDKEAIVLSVLHDVLDASQRKALVGAVHARAAVEEGQAKLFEPDAGDWVGRRLARMTNDLALDDGQQKQVAAILAKEPPPTAENDTAKKQLEAVLTAFQADSFDAAKVVKDTSKTPHEAMDRQIAFANRILAVLQPDQRAKFAAGIARPLRHGPGPGAAPAVP